MKEYEINIKTLVIIPINENKSRVIEKDGDFIVNLSSKEIMDNSCKFFGSSYDGRLQGTKTLTGLSYKAPIIIEETKKIIFFPTKSPRSSSCCWVSYNNISRYEELENKEVIIHFNNGKKVKLKTSYQIIDNQVLRSTRLELVLIKRINEFI